MNPSEFLDLGDRLLAGTSPCELRTGMNRLYLANHLVAIDRVAQKWSYVAPRDGPDHGRVIQFMRRHGRLKVLASMLDALREARRHADYHMSNDETRECEYCAHSSADIEFQSERVEVLEALAQDLFSRLEKL
jgi:hypothetical protein